MREGRDNSVHPIDLTLMPFIHQHLTDLRTPRLLQHQTSAISSETNMLFDPQSILLGQSMSYVTLRHSSCQLLLQF